jgi:hypothetical protein
MKLGRREFLVAAGATALVAALPNVPEAATRPWPLEEYLTGMIGGRFEQRTFCFSDGVRLSDVEFVNCDLWFDGAVQTDGRCSFRGCRILSTG